jgi:hypothetical protein
MRGRLRIKSRTGRVAPVTDKVGSYPPRTHSSMVEREVFTLRACGFESCWVYRLGKVTAMNTLTERVAHLASNGVSMNIMTQVFRSENIPDDEVAIAYSACAANGIDLIYEHNLSAVDRYLQREGNKS